MKTWKILILMLLLGGDAWGQTTFITRYDSSNAPQQTWTSAASTLDDAIAACATGDYLVLRAGWDTVFTLSSSDTLEYSLGTKNITIKSDGFTCRVTDINTSTNELTLDTTGETVTLTNGASYATSTRIRFFGDGAGSTIDDRGNLVVKTWDSSTKKMTLWNSAGTGTRTLSTNNLSTRPLFCYRHAHIHPASTTQNYNNYFVKFTGTGNFTLKDLTFSCDAPLAGGSGNTNDYGSTNNAGIMLRIENTGTVTMTGIQAMDCVEGGTTASDSFAIWTNGASTLTASKCFTDNTDYHGWRTQGHDYCTLSYCVFRNWKQRAIGQESTATSYSWSMDHCWLYCTADAEGRTGPTTKLRCAINFDATALASAVTMSNVLIDIKDIETGGYSWDYDNDSSGYVVACPLMKFQYIAGLTMTDCKFLHSGNKNTNGNTTSPSPQCFTLKLDKTNSSVLGVYNAEFRRCEFSGGILGSTDQNTVNQLEFYGCKIMKDGHFNSSYALEYMEHPKIHIYDDNTGGVQTLFSIDNLWDRSGAVTPAVVRYTKSWNDSGLGTGREFKMWKGNVTALSNTKDAHIFYRLSPATIGPMHTDTKVEIHEDEVNFTQGAAGSPMFQWGFDDSTYTVDDNE